MKNKIKTRIKPTFDREGLKFLAQAKKGFFWETLRVYRPVGSRDEEECVRLCKEVINRYIRSQAYMNEIVYPEVQ